MIKKFNLIIFIILLTLVSTSCKVEEKTNNDTSLKSEIKTKKLENTAEKKIISFLKANDNITEESYNYLFDLIVEDYTLNRNNDKYSVIIHIAKKTLKESDLNLKNKMYSNLKKEIIKNN